MSGEQHYIGECPASDVHLTVKLTHPGEVRSWESTITVACPLAVWFGESPHEHTLTAADPPTAAEWADDGES